MQGWRWVEGKGRGDGCSGEGVMTNHQYVEAAVANDAFASLYLSLGGLRELAKLMVAVGKEEKARSKMPSVVMKEASGGSGEGGQGDIVDGWTGRTYGIAVHVEISLFRYKDCTERRPGEQRNSDQFGPTLMIL
ncbi:hypothetical protein TIFTF001_052112 [Ficus carica]|uniref:Uncharacterized protein n=1 Tax=Ficus carica TaxID=3494 RepID=A0AA88JFX3_FICCA|nr:hypothetical protein TIFTF001_052109 [Ficus carica]GMN73016.1 hypothetical protein TIFTF001_052110 [Ficus carica]GMN73020.1 hypothetical protein TIFTF001_052111 [Ficus carica]GMN73027.1 hypothetical protein TIFTF001_052112 [Ficus carica]